MAVPRKPGAQPRRPASPPRRPRAGAAPARPRAGGSGRPRPSRAALPVDVADEVPLAQRRRHPLTSRAAVLALVVCALALALAYPLREYLSQRGEIAALERKTVEQERAVADLMLQRERWRDPAYVAAQARERLHFVRPGETAYVLLDPGETPARLAPKSAVAPERPWFSDLWASIDAADRPQP